MGFGEMAAQPRLVQVVHTSIKKFSSKAKTIITGIPTAMMDINCSHTGADANHWVIASENSTNHVIVI